MSNEEIAIYPSNANPNYIALFDLDGTLADYESALFAKMLLMMAPGEPQFTWEDRDKPELAFFEARMDTIKSVPGFWANLPCMEAGFQILQEFIDANFQIEILTKGPRRTPIAWKEKVEWCMTHLSHVPNLNINIVMNKGLVYGKVLVDDYPPYIKAWLQWRPRGWVIMPAAKHNENFTHERVVRYTGDISVVRKVITTIKSP